MVNFLQTFAFLAVSLSLAASDIGDTLFKQGQQAEKAGDTFHAYVYYVCASAADPQNALFAERKVALRSIAMASRSTTLGDDPGARTDDPAGIDDSRDPDDPDVSTDAPEPPQEPPSARDLKDAREALPAPTLIGSPERKSFDLKGDPRPIFEKVAEAYGITLVFEADYQSPRAFTFRMNDATYQEAFRGLEAVTDSFLIPITSKIALVSRDTAQKRTEREPVVAVSIPIPERLSVQEAQELVQVIQQTLDVRRISPDPTKHVIFIRDRASKIMAARQILATLSRPRTQFDIEVEFMEAGKTSSLGYGMNLPSQVSLVNFGHFLHNTPTVLSGFSKFLTFGGGATLLGLGITDASAFATLANASANNLLRAHMVTMDGQAASLHVGQHYPIITNTYIGSGGTTAGQVFAPPPTINFEDLGLVLKITPVANGDDEVTLDVDAEFKVLGASTAVGIPIISNRKLTGKVRLKNGEWAVLAGLVSTSNSDTFSGYPGISKVPVLGRALGRTSVEKDSSEVLLVIKPRYVNLPPWGFPSKAIWVGSDTRPLSLF